MLWFIRLLCTWRINDLQDRISKLEEKVSPIKTLPAHVRADYTRLMERKKLSKERWQRWLHNHQPEDLRAV